MQQLELRFAPTLDNAQWATVAVRQITAALLDTLETSGSGDQDQFLSEIELATGEACCNAVKHGPDEGEEHTHVSIFFTSSESSFIITVDDGNEPYDFSDREPDFESLPESGYGLYIIRKLMNKVSCRREKGRNILIMEKNIPQGEE